MKLEELRASLEGEKSKENEILKNELAKAKNAYNLKEKEHTEKIAALISDCRALSNRCWALTGGSMCIFCRLSKYVCDHKAKLTPFKQKENE